MASGANISMSSGTNGASIAYQMNEAIGGGHWMLYTEPLPATIVDSLAATAIRIGFKQSSVEMYHNKKKSVL